MRRRRTRANGWFEVIAGDGAIEETLGNADLEAADALGALTGDLNDNFVACMIAKEHGCRTVLRVDEDYREEVYRRYAYDVDEIVYPERLGAIGAKNALLGGSIRAVADIGRCGSACSTIQRQSTTVRRSGTGRSRPFGGTTASRSAIPTRTKRWRPAPGRDRPTSGRSRRS